jgi:CubicO group peptidase (beta-lactamase class C family)
MRFGVLLLLVLLRPCAASAQAKPLQGFDEYVARSMAAWQVPGLAVAVVRHDSVLLVKGYGVRTVGKPDKVDSRTLFAIGSASKAFTAMAVAMLVDQGKIKWDDRATNYLPELQLYDAYATHELTVRDLLTHRSGLTAADLMLFAEHMSRDSVLHQVRYVKPTYSFRSHFGYSNLMYLAAGQLSARVTGTSWDSVMSRMIFAPLGMTSSNTSVTMLEHLPNVATPHAEIDDTVRTIPYFNLDAIAPAGSINSNVLDMAQWVRFQLAGGKVAGKSLIDTAAFDETHTPQTIVPLEGFWKTVIQGTHLFNYGMGWMLHDYKGRLVVQHGGNIDGMTALVAMMPEEKTGIVILSNLDQNDLTYALMYRVFDAYLKQPPKDWSAIFLAASRNSEAEAKAERQKQERQRVPGTSPSLPLERYAGTYTDTLNGDAVVRREARGLVLQYGSLVGDLAHWHYDTFRLIWRQRRLGKGFVTFSLDAGGKIDALNVVDLAEFRRKPEVADTTPGDQSVSNHTGSRQ